MINNWNKEYNCNDFKLTKKPNIYKENSLEFILVDELIKTYTKEERWFDYKLFLKEVLEQIKEKNIQTKMDNIFVGNLICKAIWHGRLCGVLEPKTLLDKHHSFKSEVPLFGVFLECGMCDLWKDAVSKHVLIQGSPNIKKTEHLLKVAKISSDMRKKYLMPTLSSKKSEESGKVFLEHLDLENYTYEYYKNYTHLNIPFNTWSDNTENDVFPQTRGSFHHLGDEMSFILAALQYGDCCILGNDEFGDLLVLKHIKSDKYVELSRFNYTGKTLSNKDFDYIYGVPRTKSAFPTEKNNVFTYSDENRDHFKFLNRENAAINSSYWENPVFKKYAGRKIKTVTMKYLVTKLKKTVEQSLSNKDLEIIKEIFIKKEKLNFNFTKKKVNSINARIEKKYSFFIKTIAHKVNCSIINPNSENGLGFFRKNQTLNSENLLEDKKNLINLTTLLNYFDKCIQDIKTIDVQYKYFWDNEKYWFDFLIEHIDKNSIEDFYLKSLYYYWYTLEEKTLVIADLVPMDFEYRIFIVNGKIASGSPCFRNTTPFNAWDDGKLDPRLCHGHNAHDTILNKETRQIVAKYGKFARKFIKEIKENNPQYINYVLDVCYSKQGETFKVLPVEINSINFSGAYQIDFRKVCGAFAQKPIHKKAIKELNLNFQKMLDEIPLYKNLEKAAQDVINSTYLEVKPFLGDEQEKMLEL